MIAHERTSPWLAGILACGLLFAAFGCGDDGAGTGDSSADWSDDAGREILDGEEDAGPETDVDGEEDADPEADAEGGADADADAEDGGDADGTDVSLPVNCSAIDDSITAAGLLEHMEALEALAAAAGGNREVGSPGWEASRDYVREQLEAFGYAVTAGPSEYPYWVDLGGHILERVSPTPRTYVYTDGSAAGGDFSFMAMSSPGDLTAPLAAIDLALGPDNTSTSGCEPADFASFPAGSIALVFMTCLGCLALVLRKSRRLRLHLNLANACAPANSWPPPSNPQSLSPTTSARASSASVRRSSSPCS